MSDPDVVVVGSGPNGLAAAIAMAQGGAKVLVLEAMDVIGGGMRSSALTLPGYLHDECSAAHPMGVLSPYFRTLPLHEHGLRWIRPRASAAHPLDGQPAVLLRTSVEETCADLGVDGESYRRLVAPFLGDLHGFFDDALAPLRIPKHPFTLVRFGLHALRSAVGLARRFDGVRARALLGGCAAHAILPLDRALTAAVGLIFLLTAHAEPWPVAEGGSAAIAKALASLLASLGGTIETGRFVRTLADLPTARLYLFDTSPAQLASIAGPVLPARYLRRLGAYRYGPGVFKMDWALDGSIPWRDPRCLEASTVHVGGTIEELAASEGAMFRGDHADKPFVLVVQQSELDPGRAPPGKQTGYAYCHVPANSTVDMTERIEAQIERFAPGFRDRILARKTTGTADLQRHNPNLVGGAISGGVSDLFQLFTRPVARLNPYTTPNRRILICSSSTPPGGGVHGMCGFYAAKTALRRIDRLPRTPLGG